MIGTDETLIDSTSSSGKRGGREQMPMIFRLQSWSFLTQDVEGEGIAGSGPVLYFLK